LSAFLVDFLVCLSDTQDMTESTDAPRITATALRQALATRAGVIVQDLADGAVYAVPHGLTKAQTLDDSLVVVLTRDEAASYLAAADGRHADAARAASTVLAWEIEFVDRQLAAAAGRSEQ
jgi:hypothetical protein